MYNIHPTDFLIFSFDREAFQSKVLFQRPRNFGGSIHMRTLKISDLYSGDRSEENKWYCLGSDQI